MKAQHLSLFWYAWSLVSELENCSWSSWRPPFWGNTLTPCGPLHFSSEHSPLFQAASPLWAFMYFSVSHKETGWEDGWVKCLLCKHKDLSSKPQYPCKKPGTMACLCNFSSERCAQEHTHIYAGTYMCTQIITGFMGEPQSIQFILFFSCPSPNTAH